MRFRDQIPRLNLAPIANGAASRHLVRVRVRCGERVGRYRGGVVTIRQAGRIVGRVRFAVSSRHGRRSLVVVVHVRDAHAGLASLELRGASTWVTRLVAQTAIPLR